MNINLYSGNNQSNRTHLSHKTHLSISLFRMYNTSQPFNPNLWGEFGLFSLLNTWWHTCAGARSVILCAEADVHHYKHYFLSQMFKMNTIQKVTHRMMELKDRSFMVNLITFNHKHEAGSVPALTQCNYTPGAAGTSSRPTWSSADLHFNGSLRNTQEMKTADEPITTRLWKDYQVHVCFKLSDINTLCEMSWRPHPFLSHISDASCLKDELSRLLRFLSR